MDRSVHGDKALDEQAVEAFLQLMQWQQSAPPPSVDADIKQPPTSMQEAVERITEHKAAFDIVKKQVAAWNRHKTHTARYVLAVEMVHSAWEVQLKHSLVDLKNEIDMYNEYVRLDFEDAKDDKDPGKYTKFSQEANDAYQKFSKHFDCITAKSKRRRLSIPKECEAVLQSDNEDDDEEVAPNQSSSSGGDEAPENMTDSVPGEPVPADSSMGGPSNAKQSTGTASPGIVKKED